MSLNWNISKVENSETVCFTGSGDERQLTPLTNRIIWETMLVDIGEITEENAFEFAVRSALLCDLYATASIERQQPLSLAEVKMHIGLTTNVATISRSRWITRMKKALEVRVKEYEWRLQAQQRDDASSVERLYGKFIKR